MAELPARPEVNRKIRIQTPHQDILKQDPAERVCNWNEVVLGFESTGAAMIEASRCIQCPAAPCMKACPVSNDIPGALWELEHGNFIEAANIFRLTSTMPEVCGRICPQERLCEGSCVVGNPKKDPPTPPVSIGRLEAFVADTQRLTYGFPKPEIQPATGKSVAVVGSGPAGLTVAELVAKAGHHVVVFEAWPLPGGILRYGIPNFKLDKGLPDAKVRFLEELGVEFRCNITIDVDFSVDDLFAQGFNAVYLGHGAGVHATIDTAGDDLENIYWSTDFLVRGNLPPEALPEYHRQPVNIGKNVVVIGGGDTSMDCVRTAIRLAQAQGTPTTVTCLYRRSEVEMPGRVEERQHAKQEGVKFEFLTAPTQFIGDAQNRVTGIQCAQMELGEPDASGRRRPMTVAGSEHIIDADTVIIAVGFLGDDAVSEQAHVNHRQGLVIVDPETGASSRPGVFAGGDSVSGAYLVVTAVAQGRTAARGILEYLAN